MIIVRVVRFPTIILSLTISSIASPPFGKRVQFIVRVCSVLLCALLWFSLTLSHLPSSPFSKVVRLSRFDFYMMPLASQAEWFTNLRTMKRCLSLRMCCRKVVESSPKKSKSNLLSPSDSYKLIVPLYVISLDLFVRVSVNIVICWLSHPYWKHFIRVFVFAVTCQSSNRNSPLSQYEREERCGVLLHFGAFSY